MNSPGHFNFLKCEQVDPTFYLVQTKRWLLRKKIHPLLSGGGVHPARTQEIEEESKQNTTQASQVKWSFKEKKKERKGSA